MLNFISCRRGGKVSLLSKCHNDYHGALSRLSQSWLTEGVGWRHLSQSLRLVTAPLTSELQPDCWLVQILKTFTSPLPPPPGWPLATWSLGHLRHYNYRQDRRDCLQHWLVWSSLTSVLTGWPANIIIGITAWAPGSSSRDRAIHLLIPHNPSWSPNLISP